MRSLFAGMALLALAGCAGAPVTESQALQVANEVTTMVNQLATAYAAIPGLPANVHADVVAIQNDSAAVLKAEGSLATEGPAVSQLVTDVGVLETVVVQSGVLTPQQAQLAAVANAALDATLLVVETAVAVPPNTAN